MRLVSYEYKIVEVSHSCYYCGSDFTAKGCIILNTSKNNFFVNEASMGEQAIFIEKDTVKYNCRCPNCHNLNEIKINIK